MSSTQKLNFQLQPKPIDYFKLEEDYFKPHCNISKEVISLSGNENYIEYPKHFPNLDLDKKETVVFNFPVGKGKTETCYKLIKEYDKLGWYVIVCSPFIKLVDKDLKKIQGRIGPTFVDNGLFSGTPDKICSYHDLGNGDGLTQIAYSFWPFTCNVHIMTINCFLGNPGDNAIEQNIHKSKYIDDLLEATEGKNVVLFIDELHESIHNFEPAFIANLLRWKNKVQKTYIASATFTPATIPSIKAVSLLTDKNVQIYESDRSKNVIQADIYLNITTSSINGYNPHSLKAIEESIKSCQSKGRIVNVITGTKNIAEKIVERCYKNVVKSESGLKKYKGNNTVYLLTSETELNFQEGKTNIGTTFKTGVDISDPNGVLFIVIPTITNNLNNQHYGIFTDGIPAITQSIGRLRNGGEIHIFISEPDLLLDQTNTKYPPEFSGKRDANHELQNAGYSHLNQMYDNKAQQISGEIKVMEAGIFTHGYTNSSLADQKNEFSLWYPNFHEFLLEKGQKVLVTDNPSFGKYLTPYILWACLNDQFQNATLKEIIYQQPDIKKITVPVSNRTSFIQNLLLPLENKIRNQSFRTFVDNFSFLLKQSKNEDGNISQNEFGFNGNSMFSNKLMKEQTGFTREILEEVINIKTSNRCSLSKKGYILACLSDVQQGDLHHEVKIREAYIKLLELREKFINWFQGEVVNKDGNFLIPIKAHEKLPKNLFYEAVETFTFLKENDKLVSTDVISVLQKLKEDFTDKNKGKVFKLLEELFINVTDQRVGNKKYYVLEEKYIAEIKNNFLIPLI